MTSSFGVDMIHVDHAAVAAMPTDMAMEDQFYSRATGKLKKASHHAFGNSHHRRGSISTVYTLDDDNAFLGQYPTGSLSSSQKKYIESFLQGITHCEKVDIDRETKAIHWVGMWITDDNNTIVSCSILQPRISNGMVHLSSIATKTVKAHAEEKFPFSDQGVPKVTQPQTNPQLNGKFAFHLADSLIESGLLSPIHASWSLMLLSETQPIFIVSNVNVTCECRLTHDSCKIIAEKGPVNVGIVGPTSDGQSYSFRCKDMVSGGGTGPAITIHKSGTLQYQGRPDAAYIVGKCFRECIDAIMTSTSSSRFIKSLAIIRDAPRDNFHVS